MLNLRLPPTEASDLFTKALQSMMEQSLAEIERLFRESPEVVAICYYITAGGEEKLEWTPVIRAHFDSFTATSQDLRDAHDRAVRTERGSTVRTAWYGRKDRPDVR